MPASREVEEGTALAPRWDANGLVTAVVTDEGGTVLMLAAMNEEALRRTLDTGEAHFWSRSRGELWHKGATSGNVLDVRAVRVDCDQDAVWLVAEPRPGTDGGTDGGTGGDAVACHTGRRSCFYRRVVRDGDGWSLRFDG